MRIVFGNWKYIVKNIWYVLPLSVVPAVLLALTLDYAAIGEASLAFFTGNPRIGYLEFFRAWNLIRVDSGLGVLYSVCALIVCIIFLTLMLVFVEKHMRIGKRTLSGLFNEFTNLLLPVMCTTVAFLAVYELWAALLAAMLFAFCAMKATWLVYVFYITAVGLFVYALLYIVSVFYLFLPCKQMTGFRTYDAFLYSYRLLTGVRRKLILAFLISYAAMFVVFVGCSFLPTYVFRIIAVVVYALLFMSFAVRMETLYFETDQLDREDLLQSYREL